MPKKVGGSYQRKNKPKGNKSKFTLFNINLIYKIILLSDWCSRCDFCSNKWLQN